MATLGTGEGRLALVLVVAGGMLGAPARHGIDVLLNPESGFGWSTFTVNIVGAFALGALLEVLGRSGEAAVSRRRWRLFAGTGFLGAFTTYSSFALQVQQFGEDGRFGVAVGYAAGMFAAGLTAVLAGIWCAGRVGREAHR